MPLSISQLSARMAHFWAFKARHDSAPGERNRTAKALKDAVNG